jgi:uncharacterized membrane protein
LISLYPYLKWLHILGAIAGLGANFTYPVWLRLARRDPNATEFTLKGIESVEKVANAGYATVLITGVSMVLIAKIPWSTPWLLAALTLFATIGVVIAVLYIPAQREQNALAGQPTTAEYQRAEEKTSRAGVIVIILVVAIEFLMTVKPALWR